MSTTGILYDPLFTEHDAGRQLYQGTAGSADCGEEFDSPLRLRYSKALLDATGMSARLRPIGYQPASDAMLLRVHSPDYLARLAADCAAAGDAIVDLGDFARGNSATERIARAAAGAACAAVDAVLQGEVDNAYALIRPSGHHAGPDYAMGYCYYNNVALAARHAQARYGIERVAIIDWDVHHGNGTQHIFYGDDSVLFCSLHEEDNYPQQSGSEQEHGTGRGEGYNLNIPLPAGSGYAAYADAFARVLLPILRRFAPQLILVSAGQDANAYDPLGRMRLTRPGFRRLAASLVAEAATLCAGRIVMLQEGGYSLPYLPIATLGVIEGLSGQQVDFDDPHLIADRPLTAGEAAAVSRALDTQRPYWALEENHHA
ncbi:class II histone deacetylase [Vogesella amnigena]|uniref:Class II histone deacetylase n=1 Tax=Vogesella amnigena TaxID=1507449 RepID=A0ABV7TQ61_9NEIS